MGWKDIAKIFHCDCGAMRCMFVVLWVDAEGSCRIVC